MELSEQGRTLATMIVGGLAAGTAALAVGGPSLLYVFLQVNGLVLRGWVWQLVTSIVVAPPTLPGVADVVFNAIALVWLDGLFSVAYSKKQYFAVFLATGIAGNVVSLVNGPSAASFGASGGIFGLLGGVVTYDMVTSRRVDPVLVLWFLAVFAVSSFLFSDVDSAAHAGGAVLGLLLGYFVGRAQREG